MQILKNRPSRVVNGESKIPEREGTLLLNMTLRSVYYHWFAFANPKWFMSKFD